jgi:putative membrane protein
MHWSENWHMGLMWVFLAVLLIGALLVITRFVAKASSQHDTNRPESPTEILQRRYATGEIDQESYRQMLDELQGPRSRDGDESDE